MRRLLRSAPRGTGVIAGGGTLGVALRSADRRGAELPWVDLGSEERLARAEYHAWRRAAPLPPRPPPRPAPHASLALPALSRGGLASRLRQVAAPSRLERDFSPLAPDALLGRGGFGVVVRACSRVDGREYALKLVRLRAAGGGEELCEAACMAGLPPHPNLVRYHSAWVDAGEAIDALPLEVEASEASEASGEASGGEVVFAAGLEELWREHWPEPGREAAAAAAAAEALVIQMEWCEAPTLLHVLREEAAEAARAPCHVRWRWLHGLAEALAVMHAHGWAHLDVKPANVFCYRDGAVKLADFGMAHKIATDDAPVPTACGGTRPYAAPEVSRGLGGCTASDLFSLGVLAIEVLLEFKTLMERSIELGRYISAAEEGRTHDRTLNWDGAAALIHLLLHPDFAARPTAAEVVRMIGAICSREVALAAARAGGGAYSAQLAQ
ncbi:hypothetical protein AB1Y20_001582 [Prymnesium parvum]|uniref:non-specific serine/threonine protein kinase n=1 Tax=Prymnesium parvum TaxID=97485 RepID=A0AB34KBI6_PRYPA